MADGKVTETGGDRSLTYADLAKSDEAPKLFTQAIPSDVELTAVSDWKVLGTPTLRPNARDIVTGAHHFPSDISRPGMLYGKILRPPAFGATLTAIDLAPARAIPGVVVIRDDQFVGVAAPNTTAAENALAAIAKTAKWSAPPPQPSSEELFDYLRQNAEEGLENPFAGDLAGSKPCVGRITFRIFSIRRWNRGQLWPNGMTAN